MWGATPAFERMKIDEKGVISRQIAEWESLLRRADMALNGDAEEHEKELWTVQLMSDKRDHARQAFLAWLGRDIGRIRHTRDGEPLEKCLKMTMPWSSWPNYAFEHKLCLIGWPMDARPPDGAYYNFKDASNDLKQVQINLSNQMHSVDHLDEDAIQIVSWEEEDMEHEIDDPDLREVPLIKSTSRKCLIDQRACRVQRPVRNDAQEAEGGSKEKDDPNHAKSSKAQANRDKRRTSGSNDDHASKRLRASTTSDNNTDDEERALEEKLRQIRKLKKNAMKK
ncbi:hypothetical protein DXG01_012855 [Tephrocybe rancida]|nr:hypothetical protein DXG01_012855 [Tephrocybe rancida]